MSDLLINVLILTAVSTGERVLLGVTLNMFKVDITLFFILLHM